MRLLLLALCALLAAGSAVRADDYTTSLGGPSKGAVLERRQGTTGSVAVPIDELNPMAVTSSTPGIVGFGSLALTNASTLLSTLTIGPSSGAWATAGFVDITNDGASGGTAYVCPLGGVCTSGNGIPVLVGQSFRFSKPASTMTLISASTSTIYAQF